MLFSFLLPEINSTRSVFQPWTHAHTLPNSHHLILLHPVWTTCNTSSTFPPVSYLYNLQNHDQSTRSWKPPKPGPENLQAMAIPAPWVPQDSHSSLPCWPYAYRVLIFWFQSHITSSPLQMILKHLSVSSELHLSGTLYHSVSCLCCHSPWPVLTDSTYQPPTYSAGS